MALIIAVGHGHYTDPFTCSADSNGTDDVSTVDGALEVIHREQFSKTDISIVRTWVDEILVVENNGVSHHFSWEDGLGEAIPEVDEDDDNAGEFPDFAEQEDDSDDKDA